MESTTNFVLIGHVDHGKSTCAGRILVDTGTVSEREVEKAVKDANDNGMRSWWLAYLLDLDEERVKGKTHEFTIVPIEYKDKQVNLIDVPGHRKFVKDMILGAANANLAVLICSAKKGEVESGIKGQTYEHLVLARGMGINKLIVAVNKMDHETVNWSNDIFEDIKKRVNKLIGRLKFREVNFIPISALEGTNIVKSEDKSLMDMIISTKVKDKKLKIYEKQTNIKAKCMFIGIETIICKGFNCNLHSSDQMSSCKINKIYHKKPFITKQDRGFIDVELILDQPTDIHTFVILRDGDKTVAIGKML